MDPGACDPESLRGASESRTIDLLEEHLPKNWDIPNGEAFQLGDIPPASPHVGQSVLHRAIRNGNRSMARLLPEKGADMAKPDIVSNTALHLAAELGDVEMMKLLLDWGAEPNVTNYLSQTPLYIAVRRDDIENVEALLRHKPARSSRTVDINWKDGDGMSALNLAVECGFESMACLLLTNGADINA